MRVQRVTIFFYVLTRNRPPLMTVTTQRALGPTSDRTVPHFPVSNRKILKRERTTLCGQNVI